MTKQQAKHTPARTPIGMRLPNDVVSWLRGHKNYSWIVVRALREEMAREQHSQAAGLTPQDIALADLTSQGHGVVR